MKQSLQDLTPRLTLLHTTFLTYKHPTAGIKIQYPNNWSLIQYNYNSAGNNTIVGFYSPSKTASQLGNISGVSGHFVPYVDIYNFNSQNKSLNEIVNERLNRFVIIRNLF